MRVRKTPLGLLILLVTLTVWIPQRHRLVQSRLALADAKAQRVRLDERIATATAALESTRRQLHGQRTRRTETLAAAAKVEQALAPVDPESQWVAPPDTWPDWNDESPYVWLRKETLPKVGVKVFTDDGELRPEVASVLMANAEQQRALNTAAPRLLAEYRALEVANAERTDEHLPGIAGDGLKMTIRINPMPEEGARLKQEFETALRSELREQRADLVMKLSEGWLDSQFSRFGQVPKAISVIRHPDGTFNVNIRSGFSSTSVGGTPTIDEYIPPHLLPLFSDLMDQAAPVSSAQKTGN
jgi:hypothetical protein